MLIFSGVKAYSKTSPAKTYCLQKGTVYEFYNFDTLFPYHVNKGFHFEKNLYFVRFEMSGRKAEVRIETIKIQHIS